MIFLEDPSSERDSVALQIVSKYLTHLRRIGATTSIPEHDLDDLGSAMMVRYLSRKQLYSPCRGSFAGFIWTLCRSEFLSELRRRTAAERDWRRTVSFNFDDEHHLAAAGSACFEADKVRVLDLERACRQLDEEDAILAGLLCEYSVPEAATRLQLGRSTAYRRVGRIREVLGNHGFGPGRG